MWWSVQRIQQSHWTKKLQKYIWSHDQLPLCWAFFQICFLSFVRLRLRHQSSSVETEKSVAFTSISQTLITHIKRHTDKHMSAFIRHTRIHRHVTCNHNQDFSSSCEIKGRASVWHNIYLSAAAFQTENPRLNSREVTKCVQHLNCTGLEKAAAALLHELDHRANKLTTDV